MIASLKFMRENDLFYFDKKKLAINLHNLAVPEVSGRPYCL